MICLRIIDQAWLGVTTRTLTSAWKKLWPEAVAARAFEGLEPKVSVVEEIVSLGKSMGLEVDERDVNELVEEVSGADNRGVTRSIFAAAYGGSTKNWF